MSYVPFYEFDGAAREPSPGQGSPLGRVELGDILRLKAELAAATLGKGFVLQLGNRADRWEDIGSNAVSEHVLNFESLCNYLSLMLAKPVSPIALVAASTDRSSFTLADDANFALAIRTARLSGTQVQVYAGSGIVKRSDPYREWLETTNKMQPFLE